MSVEANLGYYVFIIDVSSVSRISLARTMFFASSLSSSWVSTTIGTLILDLAMVLSSSSRLISPVCSGKCSFSLSPAMFPFASEMWIRSMSSETISKN